MERENCDKDNGYSKDEATNTERTGDEGSNNASKENIEENKTGSSIPALMTHDGFIFPAVPASPPRFVSMEQIMQVRSQYSDMALTHEIAVNQEFVLQKSVPTASFERQVKEVVHQAFWDVFKQQLSETPPNYSQAMILLDEIKQTLLEVLLPHHNNLRTQINETLDLDLIRQQAENDVLDVHEYAEFIISTMARLCAPVRDEKIQELKSLNELTLIYKGILETLDLMKLDMANYTIQQMRPHIQQHSIEYEKGKFKELLISLAAMTPSIDGLEITKGWFKDVYGNITGEVLLEKKLSNSEIITKAFMEVLQWDNDHIFPETLQMDKGRFLTVRDSLNSVGIVSSILLLTYSIVGPSIQGINSLKVGLKDRLLALLKNTSNTWSKEELQEYLRSAEIQVIKEVNTSLVEHGYPLLNETKTTAITAQIKEVGSLQHSVRKLTTTRVLEFVENVLNSSASSVSCPMGLSAFSTELSRVAGSFRHLVAHNRAVFGDYYVDILTEVIQEK